MSQTSTNADSRDSQDNMQEDDTQRWPTPSDGSFPCTQESHVSDSQTSKEDHLAAVELKLERMGYERPFPNPVPVEFERNFPLPDDTLDANTVRDELAELRGAKDGLWAVAEEQRRKGRNNARLLSNALYATRSYLTYLEQVKTGVIKPVDALSFKQEGNKLVGMRMHLLESLADEATRKRPRLAP